MTNEERQATLEAAAARWWKKPPMGELVNLVMTVIEMRAYQKQYFKTKDRSLLIRSKELESLVDKELAELLK